jgi:hypothetical protein
MSYRVEWTAIAHDRLEQLWMAAEDSRLILRAANAIDDRLGRDPWSKEMCLGDEKSLIVEPLAVDYHVNEQSRTVFIISVWMIGFLERH